MLEMKDQLDDMPIACSESSIDLDSEEEAEQINLNIRSNSAPPKNRVKFKNLKINTEK